MTLAKNLSDFKLQLPNRFDIYPNNHFVVSLAFEKYDRHEYLDNISLGLGLKY